MPYDVEVRASARLATLGVYIVAMNARLGTRHWHAVHSRRNLRSGWHPDRRYGRLQRFCGRGLVRLSVGNGAFARIPQLQQRIVGSRAAAAMADRPSCNRPQFARRGHFFFLPFFNFATNLRPMDSSFSCFFDSPLQFLPATYFLLMETKKGRRRPAQVAAAPPLTQQRVVAWYAISRRSER